MTSARRLAGKRSRSLLVTTAATLGLVTAAGTIAAAQSGNRVATAGAAAPVVALVDSASGPLSVYHGASSALHALHKGGRLQLGDVLVPGRGASARFTVHRPAGVSTEAELFFIKPAPGAHPAVFLNGSAGHLIVTIR